MRITLWAALATAALAPCVVKAEECKFEQQRTGSESAQGITKFVLVAGAGDLNVEGSPSATRIEAKGKACASKQELLDQIVLKTHREGSTLYIEALMPKLDSNLFGSTYATMDLKVTLPNNLPVEAQDSSGDATLEDLKSLKMLDSSGDLKIFRIADAVNLRDSSGDIEIDQAGSITLEDSSGDIELEHITGNVEIVTDSSGDIDIDAVAGNVHIAQDSSGEIEIQNVKGNAAVDADSSGSISVREIGGDFTVLADSGGGIRHSNVRGKVSVPESH